MTDLAGFDDFVRAASADLLRYARALTGNGDSARDLVQEALVRMAERWPRQSFDDPSAYARTVMVRLNIDWARRLRKETKAIIRGGRQSTSYSQADDGLDCDEWLASALQHLSPNQRTALALRYIDDLDVDGIAKRMGCSQGTARSHISRGLGRLRDVAPPRLSGELTEKQ